LFRWKYQLEIFRFDIEVIIQQIFVVLIFIIVKILIQIQKISIFVITQFVEDRFVLILQILLVLFAAFIAAKKFPPKLDSCLFDFATTLGALVVVRHIPILSRKAQRLQWKSSNASGDYMSTDGSF